VLIYHKLVSYAVSLTWHIITAFVFELSLTQHLTRQRVKQILLF